MENEQKTHEPLVSIISSDEEIIVTFADGQRIIPDAIVADLGKDYFLQRAQAFVNIKYEDFYGNYYKTVEKRQLNQIQNDFISAHFGQVF